MIAYKGFETGLTCRGFQYMDGRTYVCKEEPKKCRQGFHASIMPLHVLKYYNDGTYRRVNIPNKCLDIHDELFSDDSKICGSKISICKEPIYDLHMEQRKVMEYITHTCTHRYGISSYGRVSNWVDRLYVCTKEYIRALNDYNTSGMSFYDIQGPHLGILAKPVTIKTVNELMSLVDRFWSILVCHFETGLDHKDFYDSIDKITCGKIENEYYNSTTKHNADQSLQSAT